MVDPEESAAFKDFEARWKAIHEEGEEKNWLIWEGGYEGELVPYSPEEREQAEKLAAERQAEALAEYHRKEKDRQKKEKYERAQKTLRDHYYGKGV